jgi:hypothetical protein
MREVLITKKPASALIKNRRLGLILALLVVLYIAAVIVFIIEY